MSPDPAAFLEWLLDGGCSRGTAAAYDSEVRRMERHGGNPEAYVSQAGLGSSTLRRRRAAMGAWFRFLGAVISLPPPPVGQTPRCRRAAVRTRALPAPATLADLDVPVGRHRASWYRDRALALLVVGLGLTPSRLQALQVGDVAVEEGRAWLFIEDGDLRLPLPGLLRRPLLAWLALRPDCGGLEGPLFPGRRGELLPLRTLQAGVRRFLTTADPGSPGGAQGARRALNALASVGGGEGALTAAALVGRLPGRRVEHRGVEAVLGTLRRLSRGRS